ncbi:MAG TPA: NAD(P)H-binding protein, partial [Actinotalea sp.]|nr:NAD(P)H-binding protein [Actinotalea sp.]
MRLAVFGATGTVGTAVVARAVAEGHTVRALVRDRRRRSGPLPGAVQTVVGDVRDTGAVRDTVAGPDAVVARHRGVHEPPSTSRGTGPVPAGSGWQGNRR